MISLLAKHVRESLQVAFPNTLIKEEEYINYKGVRLFFDFYIPTFNILVEVQGPQHTEFNKHFHSDASTFRLAKKRDRLKKEWCDLNDVSLICINYNEIPISTEELFAKIAEAQNG